MAEREVRSGAFKADPTGIDLPLARRRRLDATPLARAIGFELVSCAGGISEARMPANERNRLSGDDPAIHPYALIGLLDHLAGYAVASRVAENIGISTMELQVSFIGERMAGPVTALAECVSAAQDGACLVLGRAVDADGQVAATFSGWFAIGAFPGGFRDTQGFTEDAPELGDATGPFESLIGLQADAGGAVLAPGIVPAIGWIGLPALHGGAIGALLAKACDERLRSLGRQRFRLASLTVRYLRAARADGVAAVAECTWPGRRVAHLTARCSPSGGGEDCAQANALFVPHAR